MEEILKCRCDEARSAGKLARCVPNLGEKRLVVVKYGHSNSYRKMGGLKNLVPFTYSMMTIGSLALIGFPFLTGFYSKDLILETAFGKYTLIGYFCYFLGTVGAFFTAFYSTRLAYLTFMSKPNGYRKVLSYAYDSGLQICVALGSLAIPSVLVGYYSKDMIVGVGSHFFGTAIFINNQNLNIFDAEFVSTFYKTLPVKLSLFGVFSAFFLYNFQSSLLFQLKTLFFGQKIYNFLNRKWFFDKLYNEYLGQFFFKFAFSISYKFIDRGIFEILGPTGLSSTALKIGTGLHKMQTGLIYHYTLIILIGITFLFGFRQIWLLFGFFIDIRIFILIFVLTFFVVSLKKKIGD